MPYHVNFPHDAASADPEARVRMSSWSFRHMGMESMSILACTVNEALLQSHGGVIRVAPAMKPGQNARFTLHARGGFVVSAEIAGGAVLWVHVDCTRGGWCAIVLPWSSCAVFRRGAFETVVAGERLEIQTHPGDTLLLTPRRREGERWEVEPLAASRNEAPKAHHGTRPWLGIPRMF
jgi:alpha-L-fucosidase 2